MKMKRGIQTQLVQMRHVIGIGKAANESKSYGCFTAPLKKIKTKNFLTYPGKLKFDHRSTNEREMSESRNQSFLS